MKRIATIILAVLFIGGTLGCADTLLAASASKRMEKTIPIAEGGSLTIENVNGFVKISEGKAGSVHIVAEKVVKALDEAKARDYLKKVAIRISAKGNAIEVKTHYPRRLKSFFNFGGVSVVVNYTVEVPAGTKLSATSVNGALSVDAPGSVVNGETTNGSITVGAAKLLSASTVNGRIRFRAENIGDVETTNGGIKGEILSLKPARASVATVNGGITLTIRPTAALRVSASNVNGSITCDLPGAAPSKHQLNADLNGGGETLSVETVNGSIKVLRAAPAAAQVGSKK